MKERNIEKYTQDYLNSDFESVMVSYRRKKVLEALNKGKPKKNIRNWLWNSVYI